MAIYYIGTFGVADEETLTFKVQSSLMVQRRRISSLKSFFLTVRIFAPFPRWVA
jgi:hypothetical protein